jgi:hypothetical protein
MAIAIFENDHILQFSILALIVIYICVQLYAFFWFIFIAIFLCFLIYSIYIPFHLLEHKVKRIKKEYRLLCALSKDLADVSWAQIDIRSRQLWDSEINPKMTVILDEAEAAWMATTERVVFKTKLFLENFEKCCSNRRQFAKRYILTLYDYSVQNALFYEMKQLKKEIKHHFEKKKASKVDIYGKLERSRATIRSLQDRPIDEHKYINCKPQVCAGAALISSIAAKRDSEHGMEEKIQLIILQLRLLQAFMQDLEGLEVQSETGMVWVEEANEIIGETQRALETFIRRTERRFFIFSNQMARHKLKKDIKSIDAGFFDLFKQKERYGFKFIKRGPSKSVTPSPQKKENEIKDVTVLANFNDKKQYWLDQVPDSLTGEHEQVKSLIDQLGHLHLLYEKAMANEGVNNCREAWLDIMESTAKEAEETIVAIIKNQAEKNNLFENSYYWESLLQPTELHLDNSTITLLIPGNNGIYEGRHEVKLPMEIERMKQVITRLDRSIKVYGIEVREESTSVVGLEEDIHGVLSRLITNSEPIVSIVGMRGIGKTTLAKMIFNHRAVSNHFHYCLWVSIPQNSFGNKLLKDVGKQVLGAPDSQEEQYEREYWIEKLHNFLREKKYLLVLDNISTEEAWDTLEAAFPKTTNGSKIMLTTRHNTIASHADQSSTQHLLRLRTKEESWKLFTQMVHLPPEFPPESEKNIKAKVVGRCGGLPLAIFRLGYLMSGKDVTMQNLFTALENISQYQKPRMEAVAIEALPEELRNCLSYTRLFPRDYEIPARRLVASWVAEGLVQQNASEPEDAAEPEYVAEKDLSDLINHYMIQVLERKLNGNIKTCCLPNALREYCLQGESLPERLADKFDRGDASFNLIHGKDKDSSPSLPDYENLDSFLSFDPREGKKPGEDIWNFLHRGIASGCFLELKVLDLERVFRPILPNTIGNLINLRYLGLRWTYLEDIPPSIGNLTNLQTLDVKHTYISKLPVQYGN